MKRNHRMDYKRIAGKREMNDVEERYVIGIDYGTQSARAAVVRISDGTLAGAQSCPYPHGVLTETLPDGTPLESQCALAVAEDYLEVLESTVQGAIRAAGVAPDAVVGMCVDATSCTLVPTDRHFQPLSLNPAYKNRPHAYIKLWKHHAAQPQADRANAIAREMNMPFLDCCGDELSCEWTIPKLLEIREKDPEIYGQMAFAFDLCDFLTLRLTHRITRGIGSASFKSNWVAGVGYPSEEYLERLGKGFGGEYARLMAGEIIRPGQRAGSLCPEMAAKLGLPAGIVVAGGILDGHTSLPTSGLCQAGDVSLVIGTSNVSAILTDHPVRVPAGSAFAMDGFVPGLYAIDTGQSCTGDMLGWYVKHMLPAEVAQAAEAKGISNFDLLNERAEASQPWQCGLTVLDWWNGNRNVLCNLNLRGAIQGLTLGTRPEDIYTAMVQGIACGTRKILETCMDNGVEIKNIVACGGIPQKNPFLMRQYANLLNRPLRVACANEGPAMGAAIFAACAAGAYATFADAVAHMQVKTFLEYRPQPERHDAYEGIYRRFCRYYEALGRSDTF